MVACFHGMRLEQKGENGQSINRRIARSATKCLRRFLGRLTIPAGPPPDEARSFRPSVVQVWGQVQMANRLYSSLDDKRGACQLAMPLVRPSACA